MLTTVSSFQMSAIVLAMASNASHMETVLHILVLVLSILASRMPTVAAWG